GEDQLVNPGDLVTLDGSSSFDSDGSVEGYLWAQTEGTAVTLSDTEPEDGIATFTAPSVDGNVVLTFSLTVEDNLGDTGTDFISIVISGGETSIYDIQYTTVQGDYCFDSPLMGEVVVTSGVVTAVQNPGSYSNFYVQDFGYDSWSGAYVYDNTQSPVVGDEVTFAATVLEYYSFTELTDLIGFSVASSGNAVTPKDITTGELADGCTFIGEALEGMLVRVTDVEVVAESDDNGEWYVDDGTGLCQIDDGMFDGTPPTPVAGTHFTAIVGVVDYSFSLFGVLPRSSDDIQSESNVTEVSVDYLTGWNMVGLPLEVEDTYYQTLFPDAFNNAMYSFNGSYSPVEYLVLGTGYLIRLSDGGTVEFSGTTIDELTISLTEGWNLISGISTSLPVDVLYNSGLVVSNGIYAFDGSYYNASTIDPGMGYWVRALADGDVTLSSSSSMGRTVPIVNHFVDANILELSNGTHSSTLYFGKDVAEEHRNSYSLPPTFPQMAFDVRFNGDMKYTVESGDIEVLNTSDNLTISYDIVIEAGEHMNWVLSSESGKEYTLKGTDEITIPSAERFVLYRGSVIPITFALHQNYPNPFNPVTKITYQLPEESYVVISIYNLIGQKIVDLVSEVQQKGHHKVMWDSKDAKSNLVSSGVYFYSITAGDHTALKKMVLMK
ncbi:MAG TPA: T9SS type A sorting domain-containing protein, partial [Candidatus Marinimicrobia bacterium]|nr:T9SS type A sorting domain-containing protein [Candidatus Neomarinimicrobiota bacterium]